MCDLFTDVQIRHGLPIHILDKNERPLIFMGEKQRGCVSPIPRQIFVYEINNSN